MSPTDGSGQPADDDLTRDQGPTIHADLAMEPAQALRRIAEAAEAWGAGWKPEGVSGGRLVLPVLAGLRRGWLGGEVSVDRQGEGTRVSFRPEESSYRIDRPAFVTLLIAAVGALITVLAPFVPRFWPLVPIGILLGLGAWLFIVARLRNSGPEEFFDEVKAGAEEPEDEQPGPADSHEERIGE